EINKRAECYIKGEESNTEKRERDVREKDYANRRNRGQDNQPRRHWPQAEPQCQGHHRKPYHQQLGYGDRTYPHARRYTPLNEAKVHVLQEIMATRLATLPPARDKNVMMGPHENA
ncbi:hypothetical protein A2U01_0060838, partial [Trifolium medium]|nr:hypothetical protein [Trifolium medium]